jgi:hypothetical protein
MKPLTPEEFLLVPGAAVPLADATLVGLDPVPLPLPTPVSPDVEIAQPK